MNQKKSDRYRAKYAFEKVKDVKAKAEGEAKRKEDKELKLLKDYESYVKSFPIMILQNGLGNAIAFAYAKSKKDDKGNYNAWAYLLWHILNYPENQKKDIIEFKIEVERFIENKILKVTSTQYRQRENEILALLKWLKRFAEGMSTNNESQKGETTNV